MKSTSFIPFKKHIEWNGVFEEKKGIEKYKVGVKLVKSLNYFRNSFIRRMNSLDWLSRVLPTMMDQNISYLYDVSDQNMLLK